MDPPLRAAARRRPACRFSEASARLRYRPLISVLMPVYNTDERWLHAAIESVRVSSTPTGSCASRTTRLPIRALAGASPAVSRATPGSKSRSALSNGHISAASNSALELASGEFIALVDHDDVLPGHALLAVVHELNRHPDADIVYSDEDRIDESGRRYDPYFKPDWNPELFCGQNLHQPSRRLPDASSCGASADFARASRAARTTTWRGA